MLEASTRRNSSSQTAVGHYDRESLATARDGLYGALG